MILDIIKIGDDRLRKKSEEVHDVDESVLKLVKNMKETLKKSKGVGLAAPQVGVNKRIIVVKPQKEMYVFINPVFLYKSNETECDTEGCLSVPGEWIDVKRSKEVEIEFVGEDGSNYKVKAKDFFARVIQHECDHLDGILIVDKKI
ncbi:MAG: peptide deformylase [Patescibacteria group bacterium]